MCHFQAGKLLTGLRIVAREALIKSESQVSFLSEVQRKIVASMCRWLKTTLKGRSAKYTRFLGTQL